MNERIQRFHERIQRFHDELGKKIAEHGHQVIGVHGSPDNPPFAYTIGLTPRFGFELLVVGLPIQHAHPILNHVAKDWHPELMNEPCDEFANLPLLLMRCNTDLDRLHREFVVQADNHYDMKVDVVQVILSDREGRTPLDADFDCEYMGRFQPLFVRFDKEAEVQP